MEFASTPSPPPQQETSMNWLSLPNQPALLPVHLLCLLPPSMMPSMPISDRQLHPRKTSPSIFSPPMLGWDSSLRKLASPLPRPTPTKHRSMMHRDLLIPHSPSPMEWSGPLQFLTGQLPPITAYKVPPACFTPSPSPEPQNLPVLDMVPPLPWFTPHLSSQSGKVCWVSTTRDHFLHMDRGHLIHTTPYPPPCHCLPLHHPLPQLLVPPPLPFKKTVKKPLRYLLLAVNPPQRQSLRIQAWTLSLVEDTPSLPLPLASTSIKEGSMSPSSSAKMGLTGRQSTCRLW